MQFTYRAYEQLISLLLEKGYQITGYRACDTVKNPVILRHDVDTSLEKAVEFARFEKKLSVKSTYFVLLSGSFYNAASRAALEAMAQIMDLGHCLGIHFDETRYQDLCEGAMENYGTYIGQEANILERLTGIPIRCVSMHRPSKQSLETDGNFGDIINSYSKKFFQDFKYLSDSRMHWREDAEGIIREKQYSKLHILTHPLWYGETERGMRDILKDFCMAASAERYDRLTENFRDLQSVLKREEVVK